MRKTLVSIASYPPQTSSPVFVKGAVLQLLGLLLILAFGSRAFAECCPVVAGSYTVEQSTILTSPGSDQELIYEATNTASISQSGCEFTLTLIDPTSEEGIMYSGILSDTNFMSFRVTPVLAFPNTPGLVITENIITAAGAFIESNSIQYRILGIATGTLDGEPFDFDVDVAGTIIGTFFPVSAPKVTVQPESRIIGTNRAVTFSVLATGGCLTYQWRKDSQNIPGANGSTFTIPSTQTGNSGTYDVVMWNHYGLTASAPATLVVCNYRLSSYNATFTENGGSSSNVNVTVSGGCSWTVQNSNSWIQVHNGTGSGNGSFSFSVSPHTNDLPRTGYLTVRGNTFVVSQLGRTVPAAINGMTFTLTVTNGAGGLAASGACLVITTPSQEGYEIIPLQGDFLGETGFYAYARSSNLTATMSLNNGTDSTLELTFDTPRAGTFLLTRDGGGTQTGTFVLARSGPDFTGDHFPDLVLQRTNGLLVGWAMLGTNFQNTFVFSPNKARDGWRFAGQGDMNADGKPDILLQNASTRVVAAFLMDGTNQVLGRILRSTAVGWRAVALADFNNDEMVDVVLQHNTGKLALWRMQGTNWVSSVSLRNGIPAAAGWNVVGTGDFDGDGQTDILWHHQDGRLMVWHFHGINFISARILRSGAVHAKGWRIRGAADFNNDGHTDVLLQNVLDGRVTLWLFNRTTFLQSARLPDILPGRNLVGPR